MNSTFYHDGYRDWADGICSLPDVQEYMLGQKAAEEEEDINEDNPHGARCPMCGEELVEGICIDCDDNKNFGEACRAFYESEVK